MPRIGLLVAALFVAASCDSAPGEDPPADGAKDAGLDAGAQEVAPAPEIGPSTPDVPSPEDVASGEGAPEVTDAPPDVSTALDTAVDTSPDVSAGWRGYDWQPEGTCGMAPYEWLPPGEVGEVLLWSENPLYSNMTPAMIEGLAAELGYPDILDVRHGARVYALRYTTQDRGVPREATAMVGVPADVAPAGETSVLPVVLVMHPTVGFADRCAPSHGLEGAAMAMLPATQGFIGVAPDLLGMCGVGAACEDMFHPYLVGEPTAIAALDAVRAAEAQLLTMSAETGVVPDGRLAIVGASQGGHGALFVDRFARVYAPAYDISCVAASVPPANLLGHAAHAFAALGPATDLGLGFLVAAFLWYAPALPAETVFNADGPRDYAAHIPATFQDTCRSGDLVRDADTIEHVFAESFLDDMRNLGWAALDPWGCYALENSLPTTSVPLLVFPETLLIYGARDRIVSPEVEAAAVVALCEQGYRIEHVECAGEGHSDAVVASLSAQLGWLGECLDGRRISDDDLCVVTPPRDCAGR